MIQLKRDTKVCVYTYCCWWCFCGLSDGIYNFKAAFSIATWANFQISKFPREIIYMYKLVVSYIHTNESNNQVFQTVYTTSNQEAHLPSVWPAAACAARVTAIGVISSSRPASSSCSLARNSAAGSASGLTKLSPNASMAWKRSKGSFLAHFPPNKIKLFLFLKKKYSFHIFYNCCC